MNDDAGLYIYISLIIVGVKIVQTDQSVDGFQQNFHAAISSVL